MDRWKSLQSNGLHPTFPEGRVDGNIHERHRSEKRSGGVERESRACERRRGGGGGELEFAPSSRHVEVSGTNEDREVTLAA